MASRTRTAIIALATLAAAAISTPAHAGCGCQKPPPSLAAIRPAFVSPGDLVRLFSPEMVEGRRYSVTFSNGVNEVTVSAKAVLRRDFADGIEKTQLVVPAPILPEGPTGVTVKRGQTVILEVPASDFTMLQRPIVLTESNTKTAATCYRAAVSSDGTLYIPLDISAIAEHMIFSGVARGYRFTFDAEDIAIYNTQGILMQLLGPDQASIYTIDDPLESSTSQTVSSFRLTYDRHEFLTYRAKHTSNPDYLLDPSDPEWHVDGSRHIDHDHLVLSIRGLVNGETLPPPGTTPYFTFVMTTDLADGSGGDTVNTSIQWNPTCAADAAVDTIADGPEAAQFNAVPFSGVLLYTGTAVPTATDTTETTGAKVR